MCEDCKSADWYLIGLGGFILLMACRGYFKGGHERVPVMYFLGFGTATLMIIYGLSGLFQGR